MESSSRVPSTATTLGSGTGVGEAAGDGIGVGDGEGEGVCANSFPMELARSRVATKTSMREFLLISQFDQAGQERAQPIQIATSSQCFLVASKVDREV